MNKLRSFLKRSFALGISFALICSVLACLNITPANAKSKVVKPGKPVITVKKGAGANDVLLTIGKTKKAEGYVVYLKSPGKSKYVNLLTVNQDGTAKRTVSIDCLEKKGTYYFKVKSFYTSKKKKIYSQYSKVKKYKLSDPISDNLEKLNTPEYPLTFINNDTVYFGHYPHTTPEYSMAKQKNYDYYEDYMHDRDAWAGQKTSSDSKGILDRIEWKIIEEREDSYLLMSTQVLDVVPIAGDLSLCYYTTIEDDENYDLYKEEDKAAMDGKILTWENTNLRKWLNKEFIEYAFTTDERKFLVEMKVDACGEKEGTCNDYVTIPSSDNLLKYLNPKKTGDYYWDLVTTGTQFATYSQYREEVGPNRGSICDETSGYRVLRRIYHGGGSGSKVGSNWAGAVLEKSIYESLGCPSAYLGRNTVSYWLRDVDLSRHDEIYNTKADWTDPYKYDARYSIYKVVSFDGRITSLLPLSDLFYSSTNDSLRKEENLYLFYQGGRGVGISGIRPIILVSKNNAKLITSSPRGGTIGSTGKRYDGPNTDDGGKEDPKVEEKEEEFTVEFMPNGGTGTMDPVKVKKGSYTLPGCKFTKKGYEFVGWQVGGDEILSPGSSINVTANVLLFAKWKEIIENSSGYINFGHYEQDGNKSNGKEPIEWIVLEDNGDTLVLMSKDIIESKTLDDYSDGQTDYIWADSSLRKWLNNDFLKTAFSDTEISCIKQRTWEYDESPESTSEDSSGKDVTDKVSILSYEEVLMYYMGKDLSFDDTKVYCPNLVAKPSDAIVKSDSNKNGLGLFTVSIIGKQEYQDMGYPDDIINDSFSEWWLRTSNYNETQLMYVSSHGKIYDYGTSYKNETYKNKGIRPVIEVSASAVSNAENINR